MEIQIAACKLFSNESFIFSMYKSMTLAYFYGHHLKCYSSKKILIFIWIAFDFFMRKSYTDF